MDLQYVVQLDVSAARDGVDVPQLIRGYISAWLARKVSEDGNMVFETEAGNVSVNVSVPEFQPVSGELSWQSLNAESWLATRVELRQKIAGPKAYLVTSITFAEKDRVYVLRVAIGRASSSSVLTRVDYNKVSPPGFLSQMLRDSNLKFSALGNTVDLNFIKIDTDSKFEFLATKLRSHRLFPVLIVDTVRKSNLDFAKLAVRTLAGMAQVICIQNPKYLAKLNRNFPNFEIPIAGSKLIWPDNSERAAALTEGDMLVPETSMQSLKSLLYRSSAVVRNRDSIWAGAERRSRDFAIEEMVSRTELELEAAIASGNKLEQISTLTEQVEHWKNLFQTVNTEYQEFLQEFGTIDAKDEQLRAEHARAEYFKHLALQKPEYKNLDAEHLISEKVDDYAEYFLKLESFSEGAVVFTPNALQQWERAGRVEEPKMKRSLVRLSQAALTWKQKNTKIGKALEHWFESQYGLIYAAQDQGMVSAKEDIFVFEGLPYSRLPHIKVKDVTDPKHVARIYFAIDTDRLRFIVDHVGLHL